MLRRCLALGGLSLLLLPAGAPAAAKPVASCSLSGGQLQVVALRGEFPDIDFERSADQIVITSGFFEPGDAPLTCSGGVPTVTNTDTITVASAAPKAVLPDVSWNLAGGPFAPGATPEADGSSEIEFTITTSIEALILGGPGPDQLALGRTAGVEAANLNAGEPSPDADVFLGRTIGCCHKRPLESFTVEASDGPDTISLAGTGFDNPLKDDVQVEGGRGNDLLTGSPEHDDLSGGRGDDTVLGLGGSDVLVGGRGKDTLDGGGTADLILGYGGRDIVLGGGGRDYILPGHGRDVVRCGPGRDLLDFRQRRTDRRKSCERLVSFAGLFR
jgi:hypothetical protein